MLLKKIILVVAFGWGTILTSQSNQIGNYTDFGKYTVGFKTVYEYDVSRPILQEQNSLSKDQQKGRPIQINIWYPSKKSDSKIKLNDYFFLTSKEVNFKSNIDLDSLAKAVQVEQLLSHGIELDRSKLLDLFKMNPKMKATLNASPQEGKFPIIVIGPETAFKWCFLGEFLASHEYVVVSTPLTGFLQKTPDFERTLFEKESFLLAADAEVTDMMFALGKVKGMPFVDPNTIGIVGYSGNITNGIHMILKGIDVKAVVGLESALGGYLGGEELSLTPYYSPHKITTPILHIYNPEYSPNDYWIKEYKYADRVLIPVYDIRHEHLTSYGVLESLVSNISGKTKNKPDLAIEMAYKYTLNFLNANIKNDENSKRFINNSLEQNDINSKIQDGVSLDKKGIKKLKTLPTYNENQLIELYKLHGFEKIKSLYLQLSKNDKSPFSKTTFFNVGKNLKSVSNREQWYTYYTQSYPDFSEPYFLLAQEKQRLEKDKEAVDNYNKVLVLFEKTEHIILENIFSRIIKRRIEKLTKN